MLCSLLTLAVVACTSDCTVGEVPSAEGTLCLRLVADEEYVQVDTRSEKPLTDFFGFVFTLNGSESITLNEDGTYILPAGTHTLAASNKAAATAGTGKPLYEGSTTFTLSAGERKEVSLSLGTPQNTELKIVLGTDFAASYENLSFSLTDSEGRTVTVADQQTIYLQPGTASYTLTANARAGSHIQDASTSGSLTLEAGTSQTVTLNVQPITGLILIETGDEYNGEFE